MNLKQFFVGRALGVVALLVLIFVYGLFFKKDETNLKLCYIRNTEDGASSDLVIKVSGKKVTGYFKWATAEKDIKEGSLSGKVTDPDTELSNGILKLNWSANTAGVTNSEELRLRFSEGVVAPGYGEMKKDGGVYVYVDPEKIIYEPNLSLVDCETETVN
jgi:hypothetical protein